MSYPEPRFSSDTGVVSATVRPSDHEPDLTYSSGGTVHYLATCESTGGEFGLYRADLHGMKSGARWDV